MTEYDVRKDAIGRYLAGEDPVSVYKDLQRTKQWFFKWLNRYRQNGDDGLKDLPKRPKKSPKQIHGEPLSRDAMPE